MLQCCSAFDTECSNSCIHSLFLSCSKAHARPHNQISDDFEDCILLCISSSAITGKYLCRSLLGCEQRRRINAGSAAVPEACHYLSDVSSNQMFLVPQRSFADDRLMEMVGRRSGSFGQEKQEIWRKLVLWVQMKTG